MKSSPPEPRLNRLDTARAESPVLHYLPLIFIGLLLVAAFRLYTFSYFWIDDFNNLYWVQQWSLGDALRQLFSPSAEYFRPLGMLIYWIGLQAFDRNPIPYHLTMWAIHSLNVGLVYLYLKRATESRAGAVVGTTLFAFPPVFNDVFWSFGTIFELAGLSLFLCGLLVWQRPNRTLALVTLSTVVFFFALKTKEMTITLPVVWLLQDALFRRPMQWKHLLHVLGPGALGLLYGLHRLRVMSVPEPAHPYYLDWQGITMGRGFGSYFNTLFQTDIRWQLWCIGFVALALLLGLLRGHRALFFQLYVFVTFLPLIFLVNHRDPFYWYFPMVGISGIGAVITAYLGVRIASYFPHRAIIVVNYAGHALLCVATYANSASATSDRRLWQQGLARDYRTIVEGVQALPPPNPGETLYFDSVPEFFDNDVIRYACQVALRRTDVDAKLVPSFPEQARYRLSFRNARLVKSPESSP